MIIPRETIRSAINTRTPDNKDSINCMQHMPWRMRRAICGNVSVVLHTCPLSPNKKIKTYTLRDTVVILATVITKARMCVAHRVVAVFQMLRLIIDTGGANDNLFLL